MKNKNLLCAALLLAMSSTVALADKNTVDAAIGGAIGGALGAAVGNEIGGRDGAIVGGAIGGAAGAAIATDSNSQPVRTQTIRTQTVHTHVIAEPRPVRSLPPGLAKQGKVPPGHR
ncbi:MAG TPA: hypothetical protein VFY81_05530 [Gammaproteobacteria bacterium]|nr:hypothetical protein [Gammaproteobacteria bacterium]